MFKKTFIGLAIVILVATSAYASKFSNKSLKGNYILRVRGFDENETAAPFHTGEVAALGLIQFDGKGGVAGSVNFTIADNGNDVAPGDQAQCAAAIDTEGSTYTVENDGTGTLSLEFTVGSNCVLSGAADGALNFNLLIESDDTKNVALLLSSFGANTVIGGEPIDTLVLDGGATKRDQ